MIDLEKLKATIASLKQVNEHNQKRIWNVPKDSEDMLRQWRNNIEGLELLEKEFTPLLQALEEAKEIIETSHNSTDYESLSKECDEWLSKYFFNNKTKE